MCMDLSEIVGRRDAISVTRKNPEGASELRLKPSLWRIRQSAIALSGKLNLTVQRIGEARQEAHTNVWVSNVLPSLRYFESLLRNSRFAKNRKFYSLPSINLNPQRTTPTLNSPLSTHKSLNLPKQVFGAVAWNRIVIDCVVCDNLRQ